MRLFLKEKLKKKETICVLKSDEHWAKISGPDLFLTEVSYIKFSDGTYFLSWEYISEKKKNAKRKKIIVPMKFNCEQYTLDSVYEMTTQIMLEKGFYFQESMIELWEHKIIEFFSIKHIDQQEKCVVTSQFGWSNGWKSFHNNYIYLLKGNGTYYLKYYWYTPERCIKKCIEIPLDIIIEGKYVNIVNWIVNLLDKDEIFQDQKIDETLIMKEEYAEFFGIKDERQTCVVYHMDAHASCFNELYELAFSFQYGFIWMSVTYVSHGGFDHANIGGCQYLIPARDCRGSFEQFVDAVCNEYNSEKYLFTQSMLLNCKALRNCYENYRNKLG